jgi:hypothetical protein
LAPPARRRAGDRHALHPLGSVGVALIGVERDESAGRVISLEEGSEFRLPIDGLAAAELDTEAWVATSAFPYRTSVSEPRPGVGVVAAPERAAWRGGFGNRPRPPEPAAVGAVWSERPPSAAGPR